MRSNKSNLKIICEIWLGVCLLGSLPYLFCGYADNIFKAIFLSVSSFTTTGAILEKELDGGIFLYYLICQWLGGIAILVFLSSLLPSADSDASKELENKRPGRTLFEALKDKDTWLLIFIYALLTLGMLISMLFCGHNLWDSLLLSFTVCSTGGFAPKSLGGIQASISGTGVFGCTFMFLSSISFTLYAKLARKDLKGILNNTELKFQLALILSSAFLISLVNGVSFYPVQSLFQIVRDAFFQVISFSSTTGLSNTDISLWPGFSKLVLVILSFFGGASISTGSGLKLLRVLIIFKSIKRSFLMRIHPKAVITLRIDKKPVSEESCDRALAYFISYIIIFLLGGFFLSFSSPDMETAFFASSSLLTNLGTSFGQIGISCSYAFLDNFGLVFASLLMLLGRLEIYALLIPFQKDNE